MRSAFSGPTRRSRRLSAIEFGDVRPELLVQLGVIALVEEVQIKAGDQTRALWFGIPGKEWDPGPESLGSPEK